MFYIDMKSPNPEKKWRQKRLSRSTKSQTIFRSVFELIQGFLRIPYENQGFRRISRSQLNK